MLDLHSFPTRRSSDLRLIGKTQQRGLTLIPTRMYFKNGRVKVELALAKGKQLWDKRETERRKTADRETREAIARSQKGDRKSTRLNSSHVAISYAVFC